MGLNMVALNSDSIMTVMIITLAGYSIMLSHFRWK